MHVLQGLAVMAGIALIPSALVLAFDYHCERSYKRHQAMLRHPVGKGR